MEIELGRRSPQRPSAAECIEGMYVLTARVVGGDSRYRLHVVHRAEIVEWVVG
jgi:hypothetical protein